ncbi:GNAT family N-acetyltransferase [Streptomyces sp. 796.1]|uniref:GNAT family N-acetyltransferase n=1 Tax=Streptomyces sp. 796.1 TaxID=3163029 RepID=UPI0039C905AB
MPATPAMASLTQAVPLIDGVLLRPAAPADAPALAAALRRNREHLRPWEPQRPDDFFTTEGQLVRLQQQVLERHSGREFGWLLVDGTEIAGSMTLTGIVRGPFQNASLGYWIAADRIGRGLATAAVRAVCAAADHRLALHRVQAGTLPDNVRSQRVLAKCGFERIGTAERYLHIDGAWRDHVLFQRILNTHDPI